MTLFLISIGLYEKEDMSIKAVEAAKACDELYLEKYTSYYATPTDELEEFLGKEIKEVSRSELEENSKKIVEKAKERKIGILVIGDALSATTHSVLLLGCMEENVDYEIVHGSSVFTAVAESGLSLYKFGNTTSIPFDHENIETPYDVLKSNGDMHTLVLLDLKNGNYMKASEAVKYFMNVEEKRKEGVFSWDKSCVAFFALGSKDCKICAGTAREIAELDFDLKPQCLVILGKLNFVEEEFLANIK